jgi:hypothetical protein
LVFISRRKEVQKLLENALGILEKERKIEIFAIHSFRPEGLLLPLLRIWPTRPQQPARQLLSREPQRAGPAEAAGRLAPAAARPSFFLCHCHPGSFVGVVVVFFLLLVS